MPVVFSPNIRLHLFNSQLEFRLARIMLKLLAFFVKPVETVDIQVFACKGAKNDTDGITTE